MRSSSLNEVNPPSSPPGQSRRDSGAEGSNWLLDPRISAVSTVDPRVACTFIIPSRSRLSRKAIKEPEAPVAPQREIKAQNYSPSIPSTLSPGYSMVTLPKTVTSQDHSTEMSESFSSGTFGGVTSWEQAQTITIPGPDSEKLSHVHSFPQGLPLGQLSVPPRFSTPMVESFSDSSADGTALLTPIDGPFQPEVIKAVDDAGDLSTSDTRASLFTISAYSRTDNLKTPVVCSHIQEIAKPTGEPTRRVSFIDANHSNPNIADSHRIPMIPSSSTSTVRRNHRPSPLMLERDEVHLSHPMVSRNVSRTTASSAVHTDSSHSSTVEDPPVQRVARGGARYTQTSFLPSLPIVEFVKRVCVELRIDQEEHRTIRPRFAFKRHIAKPTGQPKPGLRPPTASKGSDAFWENVTVNGLVDLRMSAREVGTFHCGTISREAILRRLVVDGEDQKDHLSANVVLPIKENGVYTVHGIQRERKKTDPKALVWKFEYTVEDKRLSHTGQLVTGEKLLRPLSFICSPELLLPSQGSAVTIMHLITKKFIPSPTAMRILPPAMPCSLPISTTSVAPDYSFKTDAIRSRNRGSRIGTAFKALSRPTTPATDRRLRDESDEGRPSSSFSRRPSVARSSKSESKGGVLPGPVVEHSRSVSQPTSRRASSFKRGILNSPQPSASQEPHSYYWPHKWTAGLGRSADSLPLKSQRPHTTESSPRRPHTAGFAFAKSLKHMSGAIVASVNRPATAGSHPSGNSSSFSHPKGSSFRLILHSPRDSRKQVTGLSSSHHTDVSTHQTVWHMPTDEEMDRMLRNAQEFIATQQQRLEILSRSRSSRDTSVERLDSSGDISLQSNSSFGPPPKPQHHFTGLPIASPRTLEGWARPANFARRPSTANGVVSQGNVAHSLANRSSGFAALKRPHTSDGPSQEAAVPCGFSRSRNASAGNLGLPHPPRKPRA